MNFWEQCDWGKINTPKPKQQGKDALSDYQRYLQSKGQSQAQKAS